MLPVGAGGATRHEMANLILVHYRMHRLIRWWAWPDTCACVVMTRDLFWWDVWRIISLEALLGSWYELIASCILMCACWRSIADLTTDLCFFYAAGHWRLSEFEQICYGLDWKCSSWYVCHTLDSRLSKMFFLVSDFTYFVATFVHWSLTVVFWAFHFFKFLIYVFIYLFI